MAFPEGANHFFTPSCYYPPYERPPSPAQGCSRLPKLTLSDRSVVDIFGINLYTETDFLYRKIVQ